MPVWHINPYPPHAEPVDWTGKAFSSDDLKLGDFWRVGRITITVRADDYHAHVDDNRSKWACGKTVAEAIGGLISSYQEILLGHPSLILAASRLVDEAGLDSSAGSYCEVSRETIAELEQALEIG